MDEYNRQVFNQKLQQLFRQQEMDWRHQQFEEEIKHRNQQQSNWEKQYKEMEMDREERRRNQAEDNEIRKKQVDASIKAGEANTQQGWANVKISQQRANADEAYKQARSQKAALTTKGGMILYDDEGIPVHEISADQAERLIHEILNDPATKEQALSDSRLSNAMSRNGITNAQQRRNIIAGYWDISQNTMNYAEKLAVNSKAGTQYIEKPDSLGVKRAIPEPYQTGGTPTIKTPKPKRNWDAYEVN
jgi:hypothetical protein